jgi:PAS domain S-box-containing protein
MKRILKYRADSYLVKKNVLLAIAWSALISASLGWDMYHERNNTLATASAAAKAHIRRDMSFRKWATFHGGVYVPPTKHTPPNPYLKLPERDVVTREGKTLTLMNPAYILREIQAEFTELDGVRSRITSLKPLNPSNKPDPWEAETLRSFEKGEKERMEKQIIDGNLHLRFMLPFYTEKGCLKCHAHQGYREGDIRGGISTTISLAPFLEREREMIGYLIATHGIIWFVGLTALRIGHLRGLKLMAARKLAENSLRESELRFRGTFEQAAVGIALVALNGQFLSVNSRLCGITGYPKEELLKHTFQEFAYPDDFDMDRDCIGRIASHEIDHCRVEKRYHRKDGSSLWINLTIAMVRSADGSPGYFVYVVEDIDHRKRVEAELSAYRNELEHRVEERTVELMRKNRDLELANSDLESFSYSISHDLRAPLRTIEGFIGILKEEYAPRIDDEGRRLLGIVSNNAEKMDILINDILAFSRAGRHELQSIELNMDELAQEVWRGLEGERAGRSVEFRLTELPSVSGDPSAVRQVLQNLISNGIKFTRKRERAIIELGGYQKDGENVFYIRDNGAGFDNTDINKLFGIFLRLHPNEEFEGTGVGLAIVKRIITKHGGRVWAEGKPGEGATFYFTLPSA